MRMVRNHLQALGIEFTRVEAVDGNAMSLKERNIHVRRFRARLVRLNKLRPGEIGCALSHLKIYRMMVENQITKALILEDDVELTVDAVEHINAVEKWMNADKPQAVLFTRKTHAVFSDRRGENKIVRVSRAVDTDAYMITLSAARNILSVNYPIISQADSWTRWNRLHVLDVFRLSPGISRQRREQFASEILIQKIPYLRGFRWFWWKCVRVPSVIIDWLWWRLLGN